MIGTASTKTLLSQLAVCDSRASLAPAGAMSFRGLDMRRFNFPLLRAAGPLVDKLGWTYDVVCDLQRNSNGTDFAYGF